MESAMIQLVKAVALYLTKRENQLPTFALLCLCGFGWYNVTQARDFYSERRAMMVQMVKKDSIMERQRIDYITTIRDLRRDVLDCKLIQSKQDEEIALQRKEIARLRVIVEGKKR